MQVSLTVDEIADIVRPKAMRGATTENIRGIAALGEAVPGDISFLGNARYKGEVSACRASVILLPAEFIGEPADRQLFVIVDNPSVALAQVCARIDQALRPKPVPGIDPHASIGPGVKSAPTATVEPFCVIEADSVIC